MESVKNEATDPNLNEAKPFRLCDHEQRKRTNKINQGEMIKTERITNIEFSKVVTLHTSPQLRARYFKAQE